MPTSSPQTTATIRFSVLLGTGTGAFGARTAYAAGGGPTSVTTADVNGDGYAHLITTHNQGNTVSVRLGTGTGTFGSYVAGSYVVGNGPFSVTTADVNGDGHADLITANERDRPNQSEDRPAKYL